MDQNSMQLQDKISDEVNAGEVKYKQDEKKQVVESDIDNKKIEMNDKVLKEDEEKKHPGSISLKDRSEDFIAIIEAALNFERISRERNNLKSRNRELSKECKDLSKRLVEKEKENDKQAEEISRLKMDVEHRNEVIDIVKADKSESDQEYKNALAASLRTYYGDYLELKKMEMSSDVGEAMLVTLEGVFALLEKNGIVIEK